MYLCNRSRYFSLYCSGTFKCAFAFKSAFDNVGLIKPGGAFCLLESSEMNPSIKVPSIECTISSFSRSTMAMMEPLDTYMLYGAQFAISM